jgi:phospho-2-dehydro-3-deoxyheptonate aldolase
VDVARDVAGQMAAGNDRIIGVMVESTSRKVARI